MADINLLTSGDIETLKSEVSAMDMTPVTQYASLQDYKDFMSADPGYEHFKLLSYISSALTGKLFFDIGTKFGNPDLALSALALSYNSNNTVISYDPDPLLEKPFPSNINFRTGDFIQDPEILNASLIFVDIDVHDSIQENSLHEFLLANNYKGMVLWDDVNAGHFADLKNWWDSIDNPSVQKYDLTAVGHFTGTGLLVYT